MPFPPVQCAGTAAQNSRLSVSSSRLRAAGGCIRVVLERAATGWLPYFCTDPSATAAAVLQAMADRGALEQAFQDVKEASGAAQQQVRNVYASVGAFTVNLTPFSVVEAWAWGQTAETLAERGLCRWDGEARRPSHAHKRQALQREVLREEIRAVLGQRGNAEGFQDLTQRLFNLAA